MAITYFGQSSTPADGGSNAASPTVITPPASMQNGDLVLVIVHDRTANVNHALSETGGQSWTEFANQSSTNRTTTWFWCQFNGTWSADPSFSHGGTNNTCWMTVFRRSDSTKNFELDVAQSIGTFAAPADPFDVTITGLTTINYGAVVIASWASIDDNSWVLQTGGWSSPSSIAQVKNSAGADASVSIAYRIMTTPGSTGNVTNRQSVVTGDAGNTAIFSFKEISKTEKNQNGISRISVVSNKFQQGISKIVKNVDIFQNGLSKIQNIFDKKQDGISRISTIGEKYQSGQSKIIHSQSFGMVLGESITNVVPICNDCNRLSATLLTDPTERTVSTNSGSVVLEISDDGISNWTPWIGFTWKGSNKTGSNGQPLGNPSVGTNNIADIKGKFIRTKINSNMSLSVGFKMEAS